MKLSGQVGHDTNSKLEQFMDVADHHLDTGYFFYIFEGISYLLATLQQQHMSVFLWNRLGIAQERISDTWRA